MTRIGWLFAIILGFVGVGIGAWQMLIAPTVLTVAAGPANSDDARVLTAFAQVLARDEATIRLRVLHSEGYAANSAAMTAGKVDLAVVRSDIDVPVNASAIAILRRDVAVLMAPSNSGIARVRDLVGKRIGVNRTQAANRVIAETILQHYEIGQDAATIVPLSPGDARDAFQKNQIDALFAIAPLNAQGLSNAVNVIAQIGAAGPIFIPIRDAAAIALRNPAMESTEILRGAFGGEPAKPSESVQTLAVTRRLLAANRLSEAQVADITRYLFQMRTAIEREVPVASHLEAPDTERGNAMRTHPGAIAYLEGEQTTFVERNSEYLYIGAMLLSLAGSLGVGLWSRAAQSRRREAMEGLDRLLQLLALARSEANAGALDAIEREADIILADTLADMADANINETGLAAYRMAFDQVGRAVRERRRNLVGHSHVEIT